MLPFSRAVGFRSPLAVALVVMPVAMVGCGSSDEQAPAPPAPACKAASVASCSCGAFAGKHVCKADGSAFGDCVCSGGKQGYGGATSTAMDPPSSAPSDPSVASDCGGPHREGCVRACDNDGACAELGPAGQAWDCAEGFAPEGCRALPHGIACCP